LIKNSFADTFHALNLNALKMHFSYGAGLLFLGVTFLFACEEPEPYFNSVAKPPEIKPLTLEGLTEGQHITGTFLIEFIPEIPLSEIEMVSLWVDDVMQYGYNYPGPFEFQLDTKQWPQGEHTISIGLNEKNPPDIGLLNLAFVPSKMYSITVYFDHQPPTPVVLQSVVWNHELNTPQVNWQKNVDPNFYAYIVQWTMNGYYHDSGLIFDRDVTTYTNPEMNNGVIGFTSTFRVWTYNRDQSVVSNEIDFTFPEILPYASDPATGAKQPIKSKDGNELYTLDNSGVKAFSLSNNTLVRNFSMEYKNPKGFALSKDGTKLYVVAAYSPMITILEASTFEVIKTADPDGFAGYTAFDIVCGRPDRLYISTYLPNGLKIFDAATLEQVGEYYTRGKLAISSDNNTLFVANSDLNPATIYSVDITTDSPVELHHQEASDVVRDIKLSADDQTLFVIHDTDYPEPGNQFIDYWNASSLASYKKLGLPNQPFSLWLDEETISIAYGNRHLNYFEPGGILQYHITSGVLLNEWKFMQAPYTCLIGHDHLYAFGLKTWIVPINGL
jgi:hypothetical protein